MIRSMAVVASLCAVYALTLVSADPIDLLTGALLGTAVVFGLDGFLGFRRREHPDDRIPLVRRLAALPGFAAVIIVETIKGTWEVALVVLGLRTARRSGFVAIPFGGRTPGGALVTGLTTTISPGELLIDVDEEAQVILLHVLDAADPDAVRERHQRRYERWQRKVAP